MDRFRAAYDAERFRAEAHRLVDVLADYLGGAVAGRARDGAALAVLPATDAPALVREWTARLADEAAGDVVATVERVLAQSNHLHHPRYVGHQVPPPLPVAALADLVAALLNNGMAVYEMGPVATALEAVVLRWMADRLGYPGAAGGVLTSGGSLGNLTALLAARQRRAGFDAWRGGAHAGPPLAILASEQAHYSVARAAHVMGFGADGVVAVACDDRFRLAPADLPDALRRAERAGRRAIAVVASSGSTATGAYDRLPEIADFCERHGLWLHVDAAHGAAAALAPRHRALVAGIDRADSVVWDAHKMMLVPALVTGVVFRDARSSGAAFAQEASYLFAERAGETAASWDVGERTVECTKRMLGLIAFAAIAGDGEGLLREFVERSFSLARWFSAMLRAAPDFEVAVEPDGNIVCFRHRPPGIAGDEALDRVQARVRSALVARGSFYLVQTRLRGRLFLRTALMNPLTGEAELAELADAVRVAAREAASL